MTRARGEQMDPVVATLAPVVERVDTADAAEAKRINPAKLSPSLQLEALCLIQ